MLNSQAGPQGGAHERNPSTSSILERKAPCICGHGRSAGGWFASDGLIHMSGKCDQGCWALTRLAWPSSQAGSQEGKPQRTGNDPPHAHITSHWARQSDSLAQSQHRRGSMQGQGTGRCDSWGAIHVTSYHELYGAVSPTAWEAPLEQACSCFLLIPQYSAYSPAGWGQAEAAAGSQSFVQGAVRKRLSVTMLSSVLCHSRWVIIRINKERLLWHLPRATPSRSTSSLGQ